MPPLHFLQEAGMHISTCFLKKSIRSRAAAQNCGSLVARRLPHVLMFIKFRNVKERNTMISNRIVDKEFPVVLTGFESPKRRYAWLEREGSMWYFLTNLFADPAESSRKWSNKRRALEELAQEGWTVLYPYPYPHQYPDLGSRRRPVRDMACGYGLMWIDQ